MQLEKTSGAGASPGETAIRVAPDLDGWTGPSRWEVAAKPDTGVPQKQAWGRLPGANAGES
jgi:hypothetical protein